MDELREFAREHSFIITFLASFFVSILIFCGNGKNQDAPVQRAIEDPKPSYTILENDNNTPCFTLSCIGVADPAN